MFFLLGLPFVIVFGILGIVLHAVFFLPFLILRVLIKTTVALVMLPIVLLVAGIGLAVACAVVFFAILAPLLPFAFLALCVWAIVRLTQRSPAAI